MLKSAILLNEWTINILYFSVKNVLCFSLKSFLISKLTNQSVTLKVSFSCENVIVKFVYLMQLLLLLLYEFTLFRY